MIARRLTLAAVSAAALVAALPAAASAEIRVFSAKSFSVVEGAQLQNQRVVTFDDTGPCNRDGYSVTINWGDGESSDARVVKAVLNGPTCNYDTEAQHAYRRAGQYPVTANICLGGACVATPVAGTATVTEAEVSGEALPIAATSGQPFTGEAAELRDANRLSEPGDFSATIDWGDGTAPTPGTITGERGRLGVGGSHTYANPGTYQVRVTAVHAGRTTVLDAGTATVAQGEQPGPLPTPFLRVLDARPSLAVLRRGIRIQVGVGQFQGSRLAVRLINARLRTVWRGQINVAPSRRNAQGVVTARVRVPRSVRNRLRRGTYGISVSGNGLPTMQGQVRLNRLR